LSTMTNTRLALAWGCWLMTWPIRAMNGAIPVVFGVEPKTLPACTSRAASRARAPLRSYSCSTRMGWAGAGLDGGLGVHRDDAVARPQRLALVEPLVQVEDHLGFGGEVRVAGEDPRLVLPGLDGVLGEDAAHAGGGDRPGQAAAGQLGGQFRAAPPGQRH